MKSKMKFNSNIQLKFHSFCLCTSGTSCSSGVGFHGDVEHIINFKEPGCGWVRTFYCIPPTPTYYNVYGYKNPIHSFKNVFVHFLSSH